MTKGFYYILVTVLLLLPLHKSTANDISDKLKGRILLQVESRGEAWYINPDNGNRYSLGRPDDAFQVMRQLGLGISNKDFNSFNREAPSRLSGKILLKVEDSGKAYYVNPVNLKMYSLGRPADAFQVMRTQGLGITDKDIKKISVSQDSRVETIITNDQAQEVDVCNNIQGVQTAIPTGMILSGAICTVLQPAQDIRIPDYSTDVCVNIEGTQTAVPAGMTATGNICIISQVTPVPPIDLCLNIVGVQVTVPTGMAINASGDCVAPVSATPRNVSIHFGTNDAWNAGSANNFCGLNLTSSSTPDGGVSTYSSTQNDWPLSPKPVFSSLQLNTGNNAPLTGISLQSIKIKNLGTANLSNVELEAIVGSGAHLTVVSLAANTTEFSANPQLAWPFYIDFVFNPNGMAIGETLGLSITEITLVSNNTNDTINLMDTFPLQSQGTKLVIKCQRQ